MIHNKKILVVVKCLEALKEAKKVFTMMSKIEKKALTVLNCMLKSLWG